MTKNLQERSLSSLRSKRRPRKAKKERRSLSVYSRKLKRRFIKRWKRSFLLKRNPYLSWCRKRRLHHSTKILLKLNWLVISREPSALARSSTQAAEIQLLPLPKVKILLASRALSR